MNYSSDRNDSTNKELTELLLQYTMTSNHMFGPEYTEVEMRQREEQVASRKQLSKLYLAKLLKLATTQVATVMLVSNIT